MAGRPGGSREHPSGGLGAVVAIALALLLGLTIWAGLRWELRSLRGYYLAVAGALAIWASTLAFVNTYAVILPMVIGALASLILALVGIRGAVRAHRAGDGARDFWIAGTAAALLPFLLIFVFSFR